MLLSHRRLFVMILMAAAVSVGCRKTEQAYDGPKIDSFTGRLTHDGKPVSFAEGEKVTLKLHLEKTPGPMGIPVQSDGSFKIGWMPIGKYDAALVRGKKVAGGRGAASPMHVIPGGLVIEEGKTEYNLELGPKWKP